MLVPFALKVVIGLLMIDSIIELCFISSTVYWLHRRAGRDFLIRYDGTSFSLHGKPLGLLVDQGHTSNGAAGTAFVLTGLGGVLALWLRSRASGLRSSRARLDMASYYFWLVMTALSMLLTLAALIYTFVLTSNHTGQTIELAIASKLDNKPYPSQVPYPLEQWTPENWFKAVLKTPLERHSDAREISLHVHIIEGWRWNLVPMFLLGLAVCVLAGLDAVQHRKMSGKVVYSNVKQELK